MSSMTTGHLGPIELMEQERCRTENEQAELKCRSTELSIQRCQTELGITDPSISAAIAEEVLYSEEQERSQMSAVRIYSREVDRLFRTGGQPIPSQPVNPAGRICDAQRELTRAQMELISSRQARMERLRRFINLSRVEATRVYGRQCGLVLLADVAKIRAARPTFDGVGRILPWGANFMRVGEANDYLTIHNPCYPRGSSNRDLAPNFRNIKLRGANIAIHTLKNHHGRSYAGMMQDINEFSWNKPELGLTTNDERAKNQPFALRIRDLAMDSGCGRGYALVVQGHGDHGQFHGIASYNNISDVSPNHFFSTENMGSEECRMVDFSFQLISGKLPMEMAIEVGTLLIEHARFYFGARLFRSECSPLNSRYIDIMAAIGLGRFQAVEPASYNSDLAMSTWKFDLWAWKNAAEQLKLQNQWHLSDATIQEGSEAAKQPIHQDPDEPLPFMAVVHVNPTVFEDPAAFEPIGQQDSSAPHPQHGAQWPQSSDSLERSSSGSYFTGTIASSEAGTSTGLGHSESSRSCSASSGLRIRSHTGSSSGNSAAAPQGASARFRERDDMKATSDPEQNRPVVWQGSVAMNAVRIDEGSPEMPPPELPKGLTTSSRQSSSSASSVTADFSDVTLESMDIDSQSPSPLDPKGKQLAVSSGLLGQPASMGVLQVPCNREEELPTTESGPTAAPCSNYDAGPASVPPPSSETLSDYSHTVVDDSPRMLGPHERNANRSASASWDTRPKRPSKLRQSVTPEGMDNIDLQLYITSVACQNESPSLIAPLRAATPTCFVSGQQPCHPNGLAIHLTSRETVAVPVGLTHTEPALLSPQQHMSCQASQLSSPNAGATRPGSAIPLQVSMLNTNKAGQLTAFSPLKIAPKEPASYAYPIRPGSSSLQQDEASLATHDKAYPQSLEGYFAALPPTQNMPQPTHANDSQTRKSAHAPMGSVKLQSKHLQQQQPGYGEPCAQFNSASSQAMQQTGSGYHNLAVYDYVRVVKGKLAKKQMLAQPRAGVSSSSKRHPTQQCGSNGLTVNRHVDRRNLGTQGPAHRIAKPQQKVPKGNRQLAAGGHQTKGKKLETITHANKSSGCQQAFRCVVPCSSGLVGPSNGVKGMPPSKHKGEAGIPSGGSNLTQVTKATTAPATTIINTLLRNIALVPMEYALSVSNAALRSSTVADKREPVADDDAASRETSCKHDAPRHVAYQHSTLQSVASPRTSSSPERQANDEPKRRPWDL